MKVGLTYRCFVLATFLGLTSTGVGTGLASNCRMEMTGHVILNNNMWEPQFQAWSDTGLIQQSVLNWDNTNHALVRFEADPDDGFPGVSISDLYRDVCSTRFLHLISHGAENGTVRFDIYADEAVADDSVASLEAQGFLSGYDFYKMRVEGTPYFYFELTKEGIQDKFASGHFAPHAAVLGWYCWASNNFYQTWYGSEVTSMLGVVGNRTDAGVFGKVYQSLGCLNYEEHPENLGTLANAKDIANAWPTAYGLGLQGEGTNSYDSCRTCREVVSPWARLREFTIDGGGARWEVSEERGTLAYRIVGSTTGTGEGGEVASEEIPARGGGCSYSAPLRGAWKWAHLQEKEEAPGGYRWRDMAAAPIELPGSVHAGARHAKPGIRTQGAPADSTDAQRLAALWEAERNARGAAPRRNRLQPLSCATDPAGRQAEPNESLTSGSLKSGAPSTLVSNDKVLIVAPAYGIYWRLDGDRIFDLYADALSTYGGFTRENIDIFYTQELFHGGDSAFVADSIIHSPAKYVIVFGRVEDKNYGCPWITEPPLPWIHDPAYETFWHDDHALSLADWEVHAPDGSIEKSIGFVPIRFNYYGSLDLVNYYYKMLAYWENGPEGYERRLGAWTEDEDGIVGAVAVRLSMESLLDKVHPYWDVRDLWDSKIGGGALTYQDSVSEALLDGRSVALMLATLSGPSFPALAIRKSSTTLYDSLEDSGNLTHLVPMSCQAHEIDYANANGTPDTGYVSVVEKLLWVPNGGAITSIGPTRAFYQWYYVRYLSEYINQLNNASGPVRVGDLHRSIRESLFASTPSDTMRMFCKTVVLLGDPTLPVYGMFWNPVSGLALASGDGAPKNELLGPVRPNPFNASATVGVTMPNTSVAQLSVYDVMGRLVKTLVSGELAEGEHQLLWDGRSSSGGELPSGIYFLRLVTDGACETGKLTLVK